jgi:hypothetical protein
VYQKHPKLAIFAISDPCAQSTTILGRFNRVLSLHANLIQFWMFFVLSIFCLNLGGILLITLDKMSKTCYIVIVRTLQIASNRRDIMCLPTSTQKHA